MSAVQFKRKKNLTPPLLKFAESEARYVKITAPMYLGKEMKEKAGEKKREPAMLADVINLETGEEAQIICSAVVVSVLNENYPNNGYVGKGFAITKKGREPGKQYNKFSVEEIELPEESVPAVKNPKK